jgi:hypothetical protein
MQETKPVNPVLGRAFLAADVRVSGVSLDAMGDELH